MGRTWLIQAREEAGLTQQQLAKKMNVRQATVSEWETGKKDPYPFQIPLIRGILNNTDPRLFDNDIVGSVKGQSIMEMIRRQFIDLMTKVGSAWLLGDVSLALVSTPVVAQDEYIAQAQASIQACWELLNHGSFNAVERVLNANLSKLAQLANVIGPYQHIAASLAVQANIMLALLTGHKLDYITREFHCVEAVRFGKLSGDEQLLATALGWQGNTYTYCHNQPQRAIAIFNDALSLLDGHDAFLNKSSLSCEISIAYARVQDKSKARANEKLARDSIEQARLNMPRHPEIDPFYQYIQMGHSELDQFEGKLYLCLADMFSSQEYAKKAHALFEKTDGRQAMGQSYRSGLLTKKADAARALNELGYFTDCLTQGLLIAIEIGSQKRISEAIDVIGRIPENWQRETKVIALHKELISSCTAKSPNQMSF